MATIYYTASSIDGFIVDDRESLDWLITRNIDAAGRSAVARSAIPSARW